MEENVEMEDVMESIPRIVLTGGPCAGKTTTLARMSAWCTERGYHPIIVPEAATTLISSGLNPMEPWFQDSAIDFMITMESIYTENARKLLPTKKPVLICDRGICDIEPYAGPELFKKLRDARNLTHVHVRDERYNGVIFLRSAANGAEEFYSNASNTSRYESLEVARALDERTHNAWIGTPHLRIIENVRGESFDKKIYRAVSELARILGEPEPIETERGFHVQELDLSQLPAHTVAIDIVQTYLISTHPHQAERVRARGQNNQWIYFHTIKERRSANAVIERERIITRGEYDDLLVRGNTDMQKIHKIRYCFTYRGQYCELDVFIGKKFDSLVKLEIETSEENQEVFVPPFLGKVREVTGDSRFSNFSLANGTPWH